MDVIRQIGVQLPEEHDSEMQSLVGAAFVRMSQEATKKRSFAAIQRSVELIDYVEDERPEMGKNLRPKIAIETGCRNSSMKRSRKEMSRVVLQICSGECRDRHRSSWQVRFTARDFGRTANFWSR